MRQNISNQDIRNRAAAIGCPLWKIAEAAGVADTTISRWMRQEMPKMDPRRIRLMCALAALEKQAAAEGAGDGTKQEG